jgi:hypothetical protein
MERVQIQTKKGIYAHFICLNVEYFVLVAEDEREKKN